MNAPAVINPETLLTAYPCTGVRLYAEPIVLVHGWGVDSQIWQSLPQQLSQVADILTLDLPGFGQSPLLENYSQASLINWLAEVLPERCYLLGLSLGGMLSCAFAAQYPQRISGLITISSNLSFVAGNDYSQAMPAEQFQGFTALWDADNQDCLKRFGGLQAQGDKQQRQLMRQLRTMTGEMDPSAAGALLKLLGEIDNQAAIAALNCPALMIFGEADALVPVACIEIFKAENSQLEIAVVEGAGHLPHLSSAEQTETLISHFLQSQQYRLDKARVAESFGRAAQRYDSAAVLQHKIGEKLLSDLSPDDALDNVIDLGCGTGYHSPQLQKHYANAEVIGVDISAAMLAYAATQYPQGHWLCADAEDLPFEDNSQSLVFSNFALQWCEDLDQLAAQLYRVLKPQGQLCFAVPGPETLKELRSAWQQVDGRVHVNRFNSLLDWQSALQSAGFKQVELHSENIIQQHQSVRELLMELKDVGAHNNNVGKQTTLTGKQHLKALYAAYEGYRQADGRFPATWEIISCKAFT
ncbi:MAG: malonyl-ACP O-methyltransferase BioC [Porticoccaceae bacterium]|nr:malonyl-ACP O-methyltransferase BioC [Porticoccaceae bacterium]